MISLAFRQTNIIWVTVFMALAIIDIVSLDDPLFDTVQSFGILWGREKEKREIDLSLLYLRHHNECHPTIGDQDMSSLTRDCETGLFLLSGTIGIYGFSYLEPRNCTRRSCESCGWLAFSSTLLLFVVSFLLCCALDPYRWCHQNLHASKLGKVNVERVFVSG